jgi:hypothetical protein
MGIQGSVSSVFASCDEAGCRSLLSMAPATPATTTDEITTLFASVDWQYTTAKKTYCPIHKKVTKK